MIRSVAKSRFQNAYIDTINRVLQGIVHLLHPGSAIGDMLCDCSQSPSSHMLLSLSRRERSFHPCGLDACWAVACRVYWNSTVECMEPIYAKTQTKTCQECSHALLFSRRFPVSWLARVCVCELVDTPWSYIRDGRRQQL
jgi:hypothetical protein